MNDDLVWTNLEDVRKREEVGNHPGRYHPSIEVEVLWVTSVLALAGSKELYLGLIKAKTQQPPEKGKYPDIIEAYNHSPLNNERRTDTPYTSFQQDQSIALCCRTRASHPLLYF